MYIMTIYYDAYGLEGYNQYGLEEHTVTSFQEYKEKCLEEIEKAIIAKFGVYDTARINTKETEERELNFTTEIIPDPVKDF